MNKNLASRIVPTLFVCAAIAACDSTGSAVKLDAAPRTDASDASADLAPDLAPDLAADTAAADVAPPDTAAPLADVAPAPDTRAPDVMQAPPACSFSRHALRRLPPEIVLVLDRSASMRIQVPGSGATRWAEVTAAANEVVTKTTGPISWGLKYFPSTEGCAVTPGLDVGLGNDLVASMRATQPNAGISGSPLPEAVRRAAGVLTSRQAAAAQFLVLATDGEPSCPAGADGVAFSVDAVAQAAKAGVRTFVLGVTAPDAEDQATLEKLAVAGGEPNPEGPRYYTAGTKQKFLAALNGITSRITSCVFTLPAAPGSVEGNALYIDGKKIPMDRTQREGWNFGASPTQVQIYGTACEALKTGKVTSAEMVFGCNGAPAP